MPLVRRMEHITPIPVRVELASLLNRQVSWHMINSSEDAASSPAGSALGWFDRLFGLVVVVVVVVDVLEVCNPVQRIGQDLQFQPRLKLFRTHVIENLFQ